MINPFLISNPIWGKVSYPCNAGATATIRIKGGGTITAIAGSALHGNVLVFKASNGDIVAYSESAAKPLIGSTTRFNKTRSRRRDDVEPSPFINIYLTDGDAVARFNEDGRYKALAPDANMVLGLSKSGEGSRDFNGGILLNDGNTRVYTDGVARDIDGGDYWNTFYVEPFNKQKVSTSLTLDPAKKVSEYQWLGGDVFYRLSCTTDGDRTVGYVDPDSTLTIAGLENIIDNLADATITTEDYPEDNSSPGDGFWNQTRRMRWEGKISGDLTYNFEWLEPGRADLGDPSVYFPIEYDSSVDIDVALNVTGGYDTTPSTDDSEGRIDYEWGSSWTQYCLPNIQIKAAGDNDTYYPVTKTKFVPARNFTNSSTFIISSANSHLTIKIAKGKPLPVFSGTTISAVISEANAHPDVTEVLWTLDAFSPVAAAGDSINNIADRVCPLITTPDAAHGIYWCYRTEYNNFQDDTPRNLAERLASFGDVGVEPAGAGDLDPGEISPFIDIPDIQLKGDVPLVNYLGVKIPDPYYSRDPRDYMDYDTSQLAKWKAKSGFLFTSGEENLALVQSDDSEQSFQRQNQLIKEISDPSLPSKITSPLATSITLVADIRIASQSSGEVTTPSTYYVYRPLLGDTTTLSGLEFPVLNNRVPSDWYDQVEFQGTPFSFVFQTIFTTIDSWTDYTEHELFIFSRKAGVNLLYRGYPNAGNIRNSPTFNLTITSVEEIGFIPPLSLYHLDDDGDIFYICMGSCAPLMFPRPRFNASGQKIDEKAYGFSMHYDEPNDQYFIYQFENDGFDFKNIKLQGDGKNAAALKYVLKEYTYSTTTGTTSQWEMHYLTTEYYQTLPTAILPGEVTSSLISFYPPAN